MKAQLLPAAVLRRECRAAILRAGGDNNKAFESFNHWLMLHADAALERELTSAYRAIAIRALLAEQYNELRSEGKIRPPPGIETRVRTTEYDRPRGDAQRWADQRVEKIKTRVEEERVAYEKRLLDAFRVNGEPIGDCTAEVVLHQADRHEQEGRFMRLMAHGVPPQGRIRDYVTAEEAEQRWAMSKEPQYTDAEGNPLTAANMFQPWGTLKLFKGGIKNDKDLETCMERIAELEAKNPQSRTWDSVELDAIARMIKEYRG